MAELLREKHVRYIQMLDSAQDLDYWRTEHLRMSGLYWGLSALFMLRSPEILPRDAVIQFVLSCQTPSGGFSAAPGHDAHLLSTLYAVQILSMLDALPVLDSAVDGGRTRVAEYIAQLQDRESGAFAGDEWGETDTRFLYGALNALSLLGMMGMVDIERAIEHVLACRNFDGGFGTGPGAESHAGQIFTCVGALAVVGRLDLVDADRLGAWLSERQLPNGGLNGRPEKLEDVCYSWWVISSLAMIERLHWIDGQALASFILRCQDDETGGFSDRPGNVVDVFHTHFGIAGLSLMGYPDVDAVDPVYCLPRDVTQRVLVR